MGCPQCRSEEIGTSGNCLVCGFQVTASQDAASPGSEDEMKENSMEMMKMGYAGSKQQTFQGEAPQQDILPKEELPQWRQELSQRLQAIKQKRETMRPPLSVEPESPVHSASASAQTAGHPRSAAGLADKASLLKSVSKPMRRVSTDAEKSRLSPTPRPRQKVLQPLELEISPVRDTPGTADAREIQKLIDKAVASKLSVLPAATSKISISASTRPIHEEGKLILLSRTLSGLIDWIFIVLFTGTFIISSDFFSGVVFLDSLSLVSYLALFLLTYFVYSIFFLGTCGQTPGMMITELRVVGIGKERSSVPRLLGRCLGYLLSLSGLGLGLVWGLFDEESRCFHDRISKTRVIRV